jgi:hypothetical protein
VPDGNDVVVIVRGDGSGADTVRVNPLLVLWAGEAESVTPTVKEYVPLWLGVPEMTPALDNVNPGASDPEARLQI